MQSEIDPNHPVVILGGSGFIGTRLTQLLVQKGLPVRIGDLCESHQYRQFFSPCDVTQLDTIREVIRGARTLMNLAAEHRDDVRPLSRYQAVNVDGAVQVCQAAREANVQKIIFTSSVAVYGFHNRAVDESGPFEPFNEYGRTKLEAEAVYRAWAEEDPSRTLVIVRPTVVFGEGNRGNVYNLLRQIAMGRFFMVGSGSNFKSMAYVGNIAAFLAHSMSLGPGIHIANYADKPDLSTKDLVQHINRSLGRSGNVRQIPKGAAMAGGHLLDLISKVTGRTFPISAIRVKKFCETTQFHADRVSQSKFTPPFSLIDGLARTVDFEFKNQ
jgi:nucleoside-diphosphate-sugar epimerase